MRMQEELLNGCGPFALENLLCIAEGRMPNYSLINLTQMRHRMVRARHMELLRNSSRNSVVSAWHEMTDASPHFGLRWSDSTRRTVVSVSAGQDTISLGNELPNATL